MNLLIVDDEAGIREGMAAILRLEGHRVVTASTVASAEEQISAERFDAIVTDWALGDQDAGVILASADCPCFVVSGHPELVFESVPDARVLTKPVMPAALAALLLEEVEATALATDDDLIPGVAPRDPASFDGLPSDNVDRIHIVRRLCGSVEVRDDGEFLSIQAPLGHERQIELLRGVASDIRVRGPQQGGGRPSHVELRVYRDGREDGVEVYSRAGSWPPGDQAIAVDLDADPCGVEEFITLLDRVTSERGRGRQVGLLNVPSSMRLLIEALGRGDELPKRGIPGPRLPAVLNELWR